MQEFHDLAERWRKEAAHGLVSDAGQRALHWCADDLQRALIHYDNALLSPTEAANECGLQPATIRKKLSSGDWPNEGTPYRPKVRRRALREAVAKQVATRLQVVR